MVKLWGKTKIFIHAYREWKSLIFSWHYTIAMSAQDNTGNKESATTGVLVPHAQGN